MLVELSKLLVYFKLFSQCKVLPCERNSHDVNSLSVLVKIVGASQHKRQPNKSLSRFVDLKVHALHYANELLVLVRLAFQKLLQTRQTSRNNKKLSNTGFGCDYISIVWEAHKLTRYQSKEFSYISLQNKRKSLREQLARADVTHSQQETKELFDPENSFFSVDSEYKSTEKSPGSSSLPHTLP